MCTRACEGCVVGLVNAEVLVWMCALSCSAIIVGGVNVRSRRLSSSRRHRRRCGGGCRRPCNGGNSLEG